MVKQNIIFCSIAIAFTLFLQVNLRIFDRCELAHYILDSGLVKNDWHTDLPNCKFQLLILKTTSFLANKFINRDVHCKQSRIQHFIHAFKGWGPGWMEVKLLWNLCRTFTFCKQSFSLCLFLVVLDSIILMQRKLWGNWQQHLQNTLFRWAER